MIIYAFVVFYTILNVLALVRYNRIYNEVDKSPVIYDLSDNLQEVIINCLRMNMPDIPEDTEVVSLQYFRGFDYSLQYIGGFDSSMFFVIKTEVGFLEGKNFQETDAWAEADSWSDAKVEKDFGKGDLKPYIVVGGKRVWPVKYKKSDHEDSVPMTLYPSSDGYAWLRISSTEHLTGFEKIGFKQLAWQAIVEEIGWW